MKADVPRFEQSKLPTSLQREGPSHIRLGVAGILALMSCLLYLDRFAVGIASEYIREDFLMTQTQMSWFLSAFFWSYALSQVPAGWLSDRFGPRRMLTAYILAWSAFTGLLGFAKQVWMVLHLRLYCGAAQAGAYPVCGGLIRHWFPVSQRGAASSIIALGGRAGGVLAPILTAWLIVAFATTGWVPDFVEADLVDESSMVTRFRECVTEGVTKIPLIGGFVGPFPESLKTKLHDAAAATTLNRPPPRKTDARSFLSNWVPRLNEGAGEGSRKNVRVTGDDMDSECCRLILSEMNHRLDDHSFVTRENLNGMRLLPRAQQLLDKKEAGEKNSRIETRLLNRLTFEAAFPMLFKKFYGRGWRPTLIAYGLVGLMVAMAFAWVARDTPTQHPGCNDAERNLIDNGRPRTAEVMEPRTTPFPWNGMLMNVSLWGNSLMQFFTNIGWLFVVTWLPRYLDKVHGVPLAGQALMTAVPAAAGIIGMFGGGWWTDLMVSRTGLKWGRRLPIVSTRFVAALGYLICLVLGMTCTPGPMAPWLPWGIVFGLSIMCLGVDLGIPAVWAYSQDVGGKYTASIHGWSNMWGNIGAAVAPLIYNAILGESPSLAQWNWLFASCAFVFVLSGLCAFVIDAAKPISR
ncbi:MAG: MFS transporter [Planctomycetales bacterium]|nr:MFS transporter [Planctomycetales bacterium]